MAAQKLCLMLSSFESNVRESFRLMREESSYCDVTLASDDGHTIDAHRVILTAGSEFFGEVCRQAGPSKLFLYLKGIKRQELENVVDFLYNGQTYLAQEELNKLHAAKRARMETG